MAAPDMVVISAATFRLVEGYFSCADLGASRLKEVASPVSLHRVRGENETQTRLEVAAARGLTPLVGREAEVARLLERWAQVKTGHGQVIVISGEAGIGKSRLIQSLKEHVASEPHTRLECRGSPYYQHSALYPLTVPGTACTIPATLHDALMARLDRLGTAKGIAQLGATIGRQFSYELLSAVAHVDEVTLRQELGRLVAAALLSQQGQPPQATSIRSSTLSSRKPPLSRCSSAPGSSTTSALRRCSRRAVPNWLKPGSNCWRSTTPRRE
jgi:hypothetical protein